MNILHITPHLGGGVGKVILNFATNENQNQHDIVCLDKVNAEFFRIYESILLEDNWCNSKDMRYYDIIILHFWNHPLLYDFIIRNDILLPPCRLAFWSHTSGLHMPSGFTKKILAYPDEFVFTTPISHSSKLVQTSGRTFKTIWSTSGIEKFINLERKPHEGFRIGYIGTVDYAKMHPDFVTMCSSINIPDVKFVVCGGHNEEQLRKEVEDAGMSDKFEIHGYVDDIVPYLETFDIFGYPLAPYHYGTCDQVLQEAMAAGIPQVVMNNAMEESMITNCQTGFLCRDIDEYVRAIELFYNNSQLLKLASKMSRCDALDNFSTDTMIHSWQYVFTEMMRWEKTRKMWDLDKTDLTTYDIFMESIGNIEPGEGPQWESATKGTWQHYKDMLGE